MPEKVSKPKKGSKPKKRSKPKQSSKLKKVHKSPSVGTSALQERALELIGLKSEGVYQSELRKQLEIDSAKCSKIVSRLERTGLINRQPADYGSRRTYLIRLSNISRPGNAPQDDSAHQHGNASSHYSISQISQPPNTSLPDNSPQLADESKLISDLQPCSISWPSNSLPNKDSPQNHIDTYLTEFYLLYLIRGSSSA